MSTKKAGGSAKNLTDSKPKFLGVKLYAGEAAQPGSIIVRQRGTVYMAGKNVKMGTDHTLYSVASGKVSFTDKRHKNFDGKTKTKKVAHVK